MVSTALLMACAALLLLAGAIALWHGPALYQQRKQASQHAEAMLQSRQPAPPGSRAAIQAVSSRAAEQGRWQSLLMRAGLPPVRRTLLLLCLPPLLLALVSALRTGSALMGLFALLLSAAGIGLWWYRRVRRLQDKLVAQLPDFLEHMVRIAAVGNSLPMAFQGAAGHTTAPLRPVLENAQLYTRAGMDMDRALLLAAQAWQVKPLEMLAVVMGTSMRIGGHSDQILQRMADFMRDLEQAQREFSATTSETRMSAWVLGLLPLACGLMMALVNPDFFTPMFTEALGKKILLAAAALEMLGVTLLWRLSRSI